MSAIEIKKMVLETAKEAALKIIELAKQKELAILENDFTEESQAIAERVLEELTFIVQKMEQISQQEAAVLEENEQVIMMLSDEYNLFIENLFQGV